MYTLNTPSSKQSYTFISETSESSVAYDLFGSLLDAMLLLPHLLPLGHGGHDCRPHFVVARLIFDAPGILVSGRRWRSRRLDRTVRLPGY